MGLFDIFGGGSSQRRSQMMQYYMNQLNQPKINTPPVSQLPENAPVAAAPMAAAAPVADIPAVDPNIAFRDDLMTKVNALYGPNYSTQAFQDTADDPIIDAMLGRQRSTAQEGIDRAYKRGQLNTSGYNAAVAGLGERDLAARSEANQLGGGVLARYRQNVDDAIAGIRSRVGSATTGYDLTPEQDAITAKVGQLQQGMTGDITAALGGRQFYDLPGLLGRAGAEQGFVNPGRRIEKADDRSEEDRRRKQVGQVF
jgi:hypothetical protein